MENPKVARPFLASLATMLIYLEIKPIVLTSENDNGFNNLYFGHLLTFLGTA
jgi:hypothetical protein